MRKATLIIRIVASKECRLELEPEGLGDYLFFEKGATLYAYLVNGYVTEDFFFGILLDKPGVANPDSHIIKVPLENCTPDLEDWKGDIRNFVIEIDTPSDYNTTPKITILDAAPISYKNEILANINNA